ncbi:hypothetical protein DFJ74DRAFT_661539 [Hyaloraphidium curvatum]|nr:hypothetical protein DFJ74DRAFT_661539 [Hyaloraphidium curvatum]
MTDSEPLVLYDISSPRVPRSYAPNPSKARLALSFKRVPFKTTWVDILDIPKVRQGLHCPAVRKLDDGSEYYTLPMLRDPASGKVVGDSYDIAEYLEENFPDSGGCLFPADSTGTGMDYESPHKDTFFYAPLSDRQKESKHKEYARFNVHVDATFSGGMGAFGYYLPFNPETAEAVKKLFAKRAHLDSWEQLRVEGEARKPMVEAFKTALESLGELFKIHDDGPYLEGAKANYADLIVGGWVNMMSIVMPEEDWKDFKTWHGGVFGRLHDALQANYFELK